MRFFISKRLPGGFRAGVSIPAPRATRRTVMRSEAVGLPSDACYCYVIRSADGLVKIGVSTNVAARLRALQTASPHPLEVMHTFLVTDNDARALEFEAHRILDKHRCHGEWFDVTPEVAVQSLGQAAMTITGKPVVDLVGDTGSLPAPPKTRTASKAKDAGLAILIFVVLAIVLMIVVLALNKH